MERGFDDVEESNQSFDVAGDLEAHAIGATRVRTCVVTVPVGKTVDFRLVPSEDVLTSAAGVVTLVDSEQDEIYQVSGAPSAMIAAVNGAAGAPGTDVTSVAGQIAVSILGRSEERRVGQECGSTCS